MMAHFKKLKTPLGSIETYPTIHAQQRRFQDRGWRDVSARNLWELWASPDFLTTEERRILDAIEPFDEWEEFALFGCHYILLVANNTSHFTVEELSAEGVPVEAPISLPVEVRFSEYTNNCGHRRFAAGLHWKSNRNSTTIGNFAGIGLDTRTNSCDLYATNFSGDIPQPDNHSPQSWPSKRQCHTITDLGDAGAFLCGKFASHIACNTNNNSLGGRISPDGALKDCWLYHKCELRRSNIFLIAIAA